MGSSFFWGEITIFLANENMKMIQQGATASCKMKKQQGVATPC